LLCRHRGRIALIKLATAHEEMPPLALVDVVIIARHRPIIGKRDGLPKRRVEDNVSLGPVRRKNTRSADKPSGEKICLYLPPRQHRVFGQ